MAFFDYLLSPALRAGPDHELRRARFLAGISILMVILLALTLASGVRSGASTSALISMTVGCGIWAAVIPLLRLGLARMAGGGVATYAQGALLFAMLHRDSTYLSTSPWQCVMILLCLYLVGTWFGALALLLVVAEIFALPILDHHGWLIQSSLGTASNASQAPVFLAIFGLGWLYSSARDAANRAMQKALTTLSESREQYRALVENTNVVPWEYDLRARKLLYLAPQAARLLRCSPEDLKGRKPFGVIHPDDQERVRTQMATIDPEAPYPGGTIDYRLTPPTGELVHVHTIFSPRVAGATLRGLSIDVTSQKKIELELQQAQKLESVGRLAAGVAHEINTPVQFVSDSIQFVRDAVESYGEVLGKLRTVQDSAVAGALSAQAVAEAQKTLDATELDYLVQRLPKALDRATDGLQRIAVIVRSMKDFSHPEGSEMAPSDLNRAIESTLVIARNEYKYVAELETDFGELPPVMCHLGDINQAVLNIVVNAAHAIGDRVKGTDDKGRITVRTRRDGPTVLISVSDTGTGIPEANREKIFDPFFTTKEVGKGTGQGLAICRAVVVERHSGQLTVESEVGKGSTFCIRLPIDGGVARARAAA